ncbi:MAG: lanthanide-dependent methanol dehydrogenase [Acidobacteriaceae bacterium]|nr:lanthanide-dependent methanol dehydrogenase [Acidobacteriaceae bacterium]
MEDNALNLSAAHGKNAWSVGSIRSISCSSRMHVAGMSRYGHHINVCVPTLLRDRKPATTAYCELLGRMLEIYAAGPEASGHGRWISSVLGSAGGGRRQWIRATTKDYENTRYSRLDQINATNVGSLKVAWTRNMGLAHGQEAAPIVANNTMFVVAPCQNKLCALDLCKPGAPLQWSYNPSPIACCEGRPVHNEVFVGDSGGEFGVRGWLAALAHGEEAMHIGRRRHDTKDGKVLWQAYNAGPDKDMLIGARFNAP